MKTKNGFVLRQLADEYILSAEGLEQVDFTHLISLNDTAAYLWQQVEGKEFTEEHLTRLLLEAYEVSEEKASTDVAALVSSWRQAGLIDD